MNKEKKINIEEINEEVNSLFTQNQSVNLATVDEKGEALVSYAPYIKIDNKLYLIISRVAKHFQNITHQNKFNVSILQGESDAMSIFFRKRVNFEVIGKVVNEREQYLEQLVARFGTFVTKLMAMDFELIECTIISGKVVYGPGKAYFLDHKLMPLNQDQGFHNKVKTTIDLEGTTYIIIDEREVTWINREYSSAKLINNDEIIDTVINAAISEEKLIKNELINYVIYQL